MSIMVFSGSSPLAVGWVLNGPNGTVLGGSQVLPSNESWSVVLSLPGGHVVTCDLQVNLWGLTVDALASASILVASSAPTRRAPGRPILPRPRRGGFLVGWLFR